MNKRKRAFIVSRIDSFSLLKDGKCFHSFSSAVRFYKKWTRLYPNSLLCIQEIFDLIDSNHE